MENYESRITSLERARRDIEDNLVVIAALEKRQSELLREQSEYMASHEGRIREHDQQIREGAARSKALDERIEKLVSAMGEWIRRGKGGEL